jgi:hypothetical protein
MCHEHHGGSRERFDEGERDGGCCHEHGGARHGGRDHGTRCDCGCEDESPFGLKRHFVSKAEMIEALEDYLDELEKEAQGVREAIAEIKAEQAEPAK